LKFSKIISNEIKLSEQNPQNFGNPIKVKNGYPNQKKILERIIRK